MSDLGLWDPLVQFQWEQNCQNRHGTVQGFFRSLVSDLGQWGQTSDHCFQELFPWCVRLLWKLLPRIRKRMSHWLAPSQLKYMYIFVLNISVFDIPHLPPSVLWTVTLIPGYRIEPDILPWKDHSIRNVFYMWINNNLPFH